MFLNSSSISIIEPNPLHNVFQVLIYGTLIIALIIIIATFINTIHSLITNNWDSWKKWKVVWIILAIDAALYIIFIYIRPILI